MSKLPNLMGCGCVSNTVRAVDLKPVCAVHMGLHPGADKVIKSPSFNKRKAQCVYCKRKSKSNLGLAFFEYQPKLELDRYYCGCRGWD